MSTSAGNPPNSSTRHSNLRSPSLLPTPEDENDELAPLSRTTSLDPRRHSIHATGSSIRTRSRSKSPFPQSGSTNTHPRPTFQHKSTAAALINEHETPIGTPSSGPSTLVSTPVIDTEGKEPYVPLPDPETFSDEDDAKPSAVILGRKAEKGFRASCFRVFQAHQAKLFIVVSTLFSAIMSLIARFLETSSDGASEPVTKGISNSTVLDPNGVHVRSLGRRAEESGSEPSPMDTFQILFARMSITVVCSLLWMYYKKVEHQPLGRKDIRWLLCIRGLGGVPGVWGYYYAVQYIPLSDATVITFLAPLLSSYLIARIQHQVFPRVDQIAGFISILGVILIARPASLFGSSQTVADGALANVTTMQRLGAIAASIFGVFGAVTAYTTIRIIGTRAHALISVTYFSGATLIVSTIALIFLPSTSPRLPAGFVEWALLFILGICGMGNQVFMTRGLSMAGSGPEGAKATSMLYTAMIWVVIIDAVVFGILPGLWSLIGGAMILGSAMFVGLRDKSKDSAGQSQTAVRNENDEPIVGEEGQGLLGPDNELDLDPAEQESGTRAVELKQFENRVGLGST